MKNTPSMVEDEPDGDVQNAGGGVVDEPERFEIAALAAWRRGGDVLAVARTVASVDFPQQQCPLTRSG